MSKNIFVLLIIAGSTFLFSCGNKGEQKSLANTTEEKRILQQADGTISLEVNKAECYQDVSDPSGNTAEWNVVVSKSGRFNVWLSSATKDTTNLKYQHSVMLSFLDNRLEKHPCCDKIFQNSSEVEYPYFRADSFIGSLYIQDPGTYNIQIVSEKINNGDSVKSDASDDSKLLSVFFTPITR
jgi:hypothetical protein